MTLDGTYKISAPRDIVYKQLMNPEVLSRSLPGCEKLTPNPDGSFSAQLKIGIAMMRSTYQGRVEILDAVAPEHFRMLVEGKGSGGFMKGEGTLTLSEDGDDTLIAYKGEAQVGGLIASVGQRMILGAAKQNVTQFFQEFAKQIAAR
ncbi:MAG TPA: carbon monoxide dehydrogenase subunit G [Terriglobia bacterium]|nr:carbon monoxide dehydrogenase subunit G [Terriglobia bacterium]